MNQRSREMETRQRCLINDKDRRWLLPSSDKHLVPVPEEYSPRINMHLLSSTNMEGPLYHSDRMAINMISSTIIVGYCDNLCSLTLINNTKMVSNLWIQEMSWQSVIVMLLPFQDIASIFEKHCIHILWHLLFLKLGKQRKGHNNVLYLRKWPQGRPLGR